MKKTTILPVLAIAGMIFLANAEKLQETKRAFGAGEGPGVEAQVCLRAEGVFVGDPGGDVRWGDDLTRAEAAKVAVTSLGLQTGTSRTMPGLPRDVPSEHWASGYIVLAVENGLAFGYEDGWFRPEERVTMAEFACIVSRMYQLLAGPEDTQANSLQVRPAWAAKEIQRYPSLTRWLGLGTGGEVDLEFAISRSQAAALMHLARTEFGLTYDMQGIAVEVAVDGSYLVLRIGNRTVSLPVSPEVSVSTRWGSVTMSAVRVGSAVNVILDADRACVVITVD
jgi:hypothetical protein